MRLNPDNTPPAELRRRISALKAEIAAAESKVTGIQRAVTYRRTTLLRLEAQLAMSEAAPARVRDE